MAIDSAGAPFRHEKIKESFLLTEENVIYWNFLL